MEMSDVTQHGLRRVRALLNPQDLRQALADAVAREAGVALPPQARVELNTLALKPGSPVYEVILLVPEK